jgi:uncharacterized protein YggE
MLSRRGIVASVVTAAACVYAAPAAAEEVKAIGTAQVQVKPDDAKSNASIRAAIAEARATVLPLALADARTRAQSLASGSGLTLGDVQAVEEYPDPRFYGGSQDTGAFGPGEFCGTTVRTVRHRTRSGKLVRRRVRTRRCFFPRALLASVEVTYNASRAR